MIERLRVPSAVRANLLANTPSYLLTGLQESSEIERLSRSLSDEEVANLCHELNSADLTYMDPAVHVLMAVLMRRGSLAVLHAIPNETLNRFRWAAKIRDGLLNQLPPLTYQEHEINVDLTGIPSVHEVLQ